MQNYLPAEQENEAYQDLQKLANIYDHNNPRITWKWAYSH